MNPLTNAATRLLTAIEVGDVTDHAGFRTIDLIVPPKSQSKWTPGDKVRLSIEGLTLRTYTPFQLVEATGALRILAHLAGTGPGSDWCAHAQAGQRGRMLGPSRSIRLDTLHPAPVVVGDETAFGLHLAQRATDSGQRPPAIFEVTDIERSAAVLAAHGVHDARLVAKQPADAHLAELEATVLEALAADAATTLCLTGRAQTVAALRRRLKSEGHAGRAATVKAYWDLNRSGLD
jgi:NADPH-dependent ferric siderophore reductase